jgi:hypothetical protein
LPFVKAKINQEKSNLAQDERNKAAERPNGVGVELGGLLVPAIVAMALLAFGYRSHAGSTITEASGPNNQLATDRNNPNTPKPYQPQNPSPDTRNPSPDTRAAPTGSSTGSGADSGGHPEAEPKE